MQGGRQEPKILDDQGRNKSNKLSEIAPTLRAQSKGNEPKIVIAGQLDCDSGGTGKIYAPDGIAPTQLAQHGNAVTKIIDHKPTQYSINGEGIAYCLDAGYQKGINDNPNIKARRTMVVEEPRAVLTPDRMEKRQNGRRMKEPGEPMFTLTAQDLHGVVIVDVESGLIHSRGFETRDDGLSHCLKGGGGGSSGNFIYQRPRGYNKGGTHDIAPTLTSNSYQDNNHAVVGHRIRKLTPLECFRLQSYPDWWYVKLKLFRHPELIEQIDMTRNDITEQVLSLIQRTGIKEGISDSQLYKMAGNGVTSILAFEIGCRILDVINQ
jgi:site-specific DNA-cytosine methylase